MKRIKVSLYTREPITRRYKLVPQRNKPDYPSTTTFVLRYGSTWETLKANSLAAATDQKIQRELALLRGWVPTAKAKTGSKSKVLMLDEGIDEYLCGHAENGLDAVRMAVELNPDVVILDLAMPSMDGLTAAQKISESLPTVQNRNAHAP